MTDVAGAGENGAPAAGGTAYGDVTVGEGPTMGANVDGGGAAMVDPPVAGYGLGGAGVVTCTGCAGVGNCTRCAADDGASASSIKFAATADNSQENGAANNQGRHSFSVD
jgi:hypothetical protein